LTSYYNFLSGNEVLMSVVSKLKKVVQPGKKKLSIGMVNSNISGPR